MENISNQSYKEVGVIPQSAFREILEKGFGRQHFHEFSSHF